LTAFDKDELRQDRSALANALREAGVKDDLGRKNVRCPFHEDRSASLSIHQRNDGFWRVRCGAASCGFSGDVFDVMSKSTGAKLDDVLKAVTKPGATKVEYKPKPPQIFKSLDDIKQSIWWGEVQDVYPYTNPETNKVDAVVVRILKDGAKTFNQFRAVDGGFITGGPEGKKPLFNRIRLKDAQEVLLVEGEKVVKRLAQINVVATSPMGGAGPGKSKHTDWAPLAGKKIVLWPDWDPIIDPNDPKNANHPWKGKRGGVEFMREVAEELRKLDPEPEILLVDPEVLGLEEKDDAYDFLELYAKDATVSEQRKHIRNVIDVATPIAGTVDDLEQWFADAIAGKIRTTPTSNPGLTQWSKWSLPGTVTVLAGDPSATKSYFVMQDLVFWASNDVNAAAFMLEDDTTYHVRRAICQLAGNGKLQDPEWCKLNPEKVKQAQTAFMPLIRKLRKRIWDAPDKQVTYDELYAWCEARVAEGCEVLVIDPITAVDSEREKWIEDSRFIMKAKALMKRSGSRLYLVTHPRGGQGKTVGVDGLAGGRAFGRFTHTVFWLKRYDELETVTVRPFKQSGMLKTSYINREMGIWKGRNSPFTGGRIGFFFSDGLTFKEEGMIVEEETSAPV
jgi:hypothetical protein